MNDIIYAVYYPGSHRKHYLTITENEGKAIEVAKSAQGFPVEKWENGNCVNNYYLDFSICGKDRQ